MKIALRAMSAPEVVWMRLVVGAVTLGGIVVVRRCVLPRDPVLWVHLGAAGVLLCAAPYLLIAWGEQGVSSGLAGAVNASTPVAAALFTAAIPPRHRLGSLGLGGLTVAAAGAVLLVSPWQGGSVEARPAGIAACFAAAGCYGLGFVYLRRFVSNRVVDDAVVAFGHVGLAAVLLLAFSPMVLHGRVAVTPEVVAAIAALGALGTGIAYVWNARVIAAWGPVSAASITYLMPVVALVSGALLLNEKVALSEAAGAALLIAAAAMIHQGGRPVRSPT